MSCRKKFLAELRKSSRFFKKLKVKFFSLPPGRVVRDASSLAATTAPTPATLKEDDVVGPVKSGPSSCRPPCLPPAPGPPLQCEAAPKSAGKDNR